MFEAQLSMREADWKRFQVRVKIATSAHATICKRGKTTRDSSARPSAAGVSGHPGRELAGATHGGERALPEVLAVAELQLRAVEAVRVLVHQDLVGERRALLADQCRPMQEEVPQAEPALAV